MSSELTWTNKRETLEAIYKAYRRTKWDDFSAPLFPDSAFYKYLVEADPKVKPERKAEKTSRGSYGMQDDIQVIIANLLDLKDEWRERQNEGKFHHFFSRCAEILCADKDSEYEHTIEGKGKFREYLDKEVGSAWKTFWTIRGSCAAESDSSS